MCSCKTNEKSSTLLNIILWREVKKIILLFQNKKKRTESAEVLK